MRTPSTPPCADGAALPLEFSARRAGLHACGNEAQQTAVADAALAPAFRWQLARFLIDFDRRMLTLAQAHARAPGRTYAYVRRLSDVLFAFGDRIDAMAAPSRLRHPGRRVGHRGRPAAPARAVVALIGAAKPTAVDGTAA